ncbi:DUF2750 domain-containing protein [Shewanella sp. 10N.286.52.A9]|uniref:DUF2750 domain-containing protein n=1 Tax=Shewanella sp. 10N.286.52.A9 TaxID=3229711 RepID=UPI00354D2FC1
MGQSSSQASVFYSEVIKSGIVWGIKDAQGFPAPLNSEGKRAMPFWSSESRAELIIKNSENYSLFKPVAIPFKDFYEKWIDGLNRDGLLVGINWSGKNATGFDISPVDLKSNLDANQNVT